MSRTIKRFYTQVSTKQKGDIWLVLLDDRPAKTPLRADLAVPTVSLADTLVTEWDTDTETLSPRNMPLTQLANLAIDRIPQERSTLTADLLKRAMGETLRHFAPHPHSLYKRQVQCWQPLLDWARDNHGLSWQPVMGLIPVPDNPDLITRLEVILAGQDDWHFAACLRLATSLSSSLCALAVMEKRLSAADAFYAAYLEEQYQMEIWGEDAETAARHAAIKAEVEAAAKFLSLL